MEDIALDKQKLMNTMRVYDEYEKRFAEARIKKPMRFPTDEKTRSEIRDEVKKILAYDEKLVPEICGMTEVSSEKLDGYSVKQLRYNTWKNVYASASLYLPDTNKKMPLIFLFCGHGKDGRLTEGYALMARKLVRLGAAVIVPDNIGQGDREDMGHWHSVGPFYCGLTLQGMIVMESVALIRYMKCDSRFDPDKFAACGNSGGGTLCLFLAALAPELCALSSSGYPSEFSYILSKERPHCSCNLLPGIAHGPEMWEVLSLFATKPLLIEQGEMDYLIPVDFFQRNARKVKNTYIQMGSRENFEFALTKESHSWTDSDRYIIAKFLAKVLGIKEPNEERDADEAFIKCLERWHVDMPSDALTLDEAAEMLTGKKMPEGTALRDIYPPTFNSKPLSPDEIISDIGRGDVMKILAQMECALKKT